MENSGPSLSQNREIFSLTLPQLDAQQVTGHVSALRPFRRDGMRFEIEQTRGKTVLHNYGHGAWGVNLSYGTSLKMVDRFEHEYAPSKAQSVAVIGAGVVGLCTALHLAQRGYTVRIYSPEFPTPNKYDSSSKHMAQPLIASQVAVGFIVPFSEKMKKDPAYPPFMVECVRITQEFLQKSLESGALKGLQYRRFFDFQEQCYESPGFRNDGRYVKVRFEGSETLTDAHLSTIIVADTNFILSLFQEVKRAGVQVVERRLIKADVPALQENYIFNCSGLGSMELFDDDTLYPVKGQLVYVQKQAAVDYALMADLKSKQFKMGDVQIFPHGDKLVLGSIFMKDIWKREVMDKYVQEIFEKHQQFRAQHGLKPKL